MKDRIKLLRKTLKLNQTEFANNLGMTMRAIQKWEAGEVEIKISSILQIQKIYHVNLDWLVNGTGSMFLEEKKDDSKYRWLINTLDKLSDDDIKKVEQEAQKILEKQNNKEMIVNHSKNVG